jgi:hypothetical protein
MTDTLDQKRPSEKLGPHYDIGIYQLLKQAIEDYLQWIKSVGYTRNTRKNYQAQLNQFLCFSKNTTISWEKLFTSNSLECFKKGSGQIAVPAINGLSRYLFCQGKTHAIYFAKAKYQNLFPTGHRRLIYQKSMKII